MPRAVLVFFSALLLAGSGAAHAQEIAVAPLSGKNGKLCTRAIIDIAGEVAAVVPWNEKKVPATWKALSAWLDDRGHEIGVPVVILGSAGKNIVLEAYDLRRVKLIGLKSVPAGKACKLGGETRALLRGFVQEVLGIEKKTKPAVALLAEDAHRPEHHVPSHHNPAPMVGGSDLKTSPNDPSAFIQVHPPAEPPVDPVASRAEVRPAETLVAPAASPVRAVVELELAMLSRSFSFAGARSSNLRDYSASMPLPGLGISAYPLADIAELAPLVVEARFRHAIGLSSSRSEGGPEHDTTYTELAARVGWRFSVPSLNAVLTPAVGYHRAAFSLSASNDGQQELDLPRVAYGSVEVRAGAEMKLIEPLIAEASLSFLAVGSAGEVFSERFFSRGSAFGFELGAGARYQLTPSWWAIGAVGLRSYALSLDAMPEDFRVADSASDTSFALRCGVRAEL